MKTERVPPVPGAVPIRGLLVGKEVTIYPTGNPNAREPFFAKIVEMKDTGQSNNQQVVIERWSFNGHQLLQSIGGGTYAVPDQKRPV